MKSFLIVLMVSVAMLSKISLAESLTTEQINSLTKIFEVKLMLNKCLNLKSGKNFRIVLFGARSMLDINKKDIDGNGRADSLYRRITEDHNKLYMEKGERTYCAIGLLLYGPDGINIEDLIVER